MTSSAEDRLRQAIKSGQFDEARSLIESGADLLKTDDDGFNSLDYAQLSGNVDFFKYTFIKNRENNVKRATEKFQILCENFLSMPDFQMKFKWKVYSWIPFISAFCPKDEWTLTKVGSRLRIDTSLANWSGFRFTKGSVSVFFDASCNDIIDSFIAVDNVSNERVSVMREIIDQSNIDGDVENLMKLDMLKGTIKVQEISMNMAKSFFRGKPKTVLHDKRFDAKRYDLSNIKVGFKHILSTEFGKKEPYKRAHYTEKTYSAKCWCSPDFPVQPHTLVPFLEALAPSSEASHNIFAILEMFHVGTPVRGEIAVFPTVRVNFQFHEYRDDVESFRDYVILPPDSQ